MHLALWLKEISEPGDRFKSTVPFRAPVFEPHPIAGVLNTAF